MPRHSSYRTHHTMEPGGGDWSSSQLIIGIAVAIVFGLTCFAAGYIIARYDNPLQTVAQNTAPEAQPAAPTTPETTPTGEAAESGGATPSGDAAPDAAPQNSTSAPAPASAPTPAQPNARPTDTVQRTGLRPSTVAPLPEPGGPTPMVKSTVDLNKAAPPEVQPVDNTRPAPAGGTVPSITPPTTAAAPAGGTVSSITPPAITPPTVTPPTASKPEPAPVKVTEVEAPLESVTPPAARPAVEKPPAPPAKPVETKPVPAEEAPTVSKGTFGIQVASFDGPRRSEQAKEVQRSVKANANQNAEIVVTPDGTYHKVVITGFKTRDAAKSACEKLKTKPGMDGAWVVRLP